MQDLPTEGESNVNKLTVLPGATDWLNPRLKRGVASARSPQSGHQLTNSGRSVRFSTATSLNSKHAVPNIATARAKITVPVRKLMAHTVAPPRSLVPLNM